MKRMTNRMLQSVAALSVLSGVTLANPTPALAARQVGEFGTSGLVFKDTLNVESFDDPKVDGVTLYISDFSIPITEKMNTLFSDPGAVGITCAKTGPITMKKDVSKSKAGEEVFVESKSLFFGKSIKVRRIFDEAKNTLLYVSYSDRIDKSTDSNKSRFKSALCAISLAEPPAAAPAPAAAAAAAAPAVPAAAATTN